MAKGGPGVGMTGAEPFPAGNAWHQAWHQEGGNLPPLPQSQPGQ